MVAFSVLILLVAIALAVAGTKYIWDDIKDDHRPYLWDERLEHLTDQQRIAVFDLKSSQRIRRLMAEIDLSRRDDGSDG